MRNPNTVRKTYQRKSSPFGNQEGFALVITLALLTFLILVLFAMTTMTRVETRMAGGAQQMSIARENAKLALDAALAQLQKYAGPDIATTARADIIVGNLDHNPYWTGVWDDTTTKNFPRTWLVSGNEDISNADHFTPDQDLKRTEEDFEGPVAPPYSIPGGWPSGANLSFVRLVGLGSSGDYRGGPPNPAGPATGEDPIHPTNATDVVPGAVVVPKIPIFSRTFPGLQPSVNANHIIGHYAFWVGDQGVKASAALSEKHLRADFEPSDYATPQPSVDELQRRLRQIMPQRTYFERDPSSNFTILYDYPQFNLQVDLSLTQNNPEENEYLANVLHVRQLPDALTDRNIVDPPTRRPDFAKDGNRDQLKDRFHDITHRNYGVLANSRAGGLRLDLSAGAGPVGFQDYFDFPFDKVSTRNPGLGQVEVEITAPRQLNTGSPAAFAAPVVTELITQYSVWQDPTSGDVQVEMEAEIQLWNPYTVDLDFSDSDKLVFRLQDLPLIRVEHNFDPGNPLEIDLAVSEAHYFQIDQATPAPSTLEAGEIINLTYVGTPLDALDASGDVINFPTTPQSPTGPQQPMLELSSSSATVRMRMWLLDGASPVPGSGAIDQDINALTVAAIGGATPDLFDALGPLSYAADDQTRKFGYNYRLRDEFDDVDWLLKYDPRTVGLTNSSGITPIDSETDPVLTLNLALDAGLQLLVPNSPANRIRLFELPIQEQVNMGALQHLNFHGRRAYALGNEGNAGVNSNFDNYFISGIPQGGSWAGDTGSGWDFPVPNTRIVPYIWKDRHGVDHPTSNELQDEESAEHLLIEGAFNINSTSVNAWRSVLGGLNFRRNAGGDNLDPGALGNGEWIYAAQPSGEPLESAVFRFPQTAHLLNHTYLDKVQLEGSTTQPYVQGVRELDEEQIYALAFEIVHRLRNSPNTPFLSLSEFVSSGIIQDAIEACDSGNLSANNPIGANLAEINGMIIPHSPAHISQADIITLLAPFMAARSDTFVVRAYGDSYNPVTGETLARAYCEALVQRVPEMFDPTDDPFNPSGNFGRRFEVIYFRWLTPDEI